MKKDLGIRKLRRNVNLPSCIEIRSYRFICIVSAIEEGSGRSVIKSGVMPLLFAFFFLTGDDA